jgi:transcription elongation factor Elf1
MLVEWNKTAAYRAATERLANSSSDIFWCARCGKSKSILGRRLVEKDGNRKKYACTACMEGKS